MDDMIMLVPTRKEASAIFAKVAERIKEENLSLNPKSEIVAIKNGIDFLGWRFVLGVNGEIIQKVKRETKKRIIKKAKRNIRLSNTNKKLASIVSYRGFLKRANTYNFFLKIKRLYFAI